jgi:hypothetical protein
MLLFTLFYLASCKKDTFVETTLDNAVLQADVNGNTWIPKDTLSATVTYTAATKSKVFFCTGTRDTNQVVMSVTSPNATSTQGFPITTFNVGATNNVSMALNVRELVNGVPTFVPAGVVKPGSGTITISAVDSVKKLISGTFSFTAVQDNYDSNGNIVSITVNEVLTGQINNMPYTFISK